MRSTSRGTRCRSRRAPRTTPTCWCTRSTPRGRCTCCSPTRAGRRWWRGGTPTASRAMTPASTWWCRARWARATSWPSPRRNRSGRCRGTCGPTIPRARRWATSGSPRRRMASPPRAASSAIPSSPWSASAGARSSARTTPKRSPRPTRPTTSITRCAIPATSATTATARAIGRGGTASIPTTPPARSWTCG